MFAAYNSKGFIDLQIITLLYIQITATRGITHAARVRGRSEASFYLSRSDLGLGKPKPSTNKLGVKGKGRRLQEAGKDLGNFGS